MKPNESLLDLLLETQILDRVPRSGYFLRGVAEAESVSEHSFHVLFLVWALGGRIAGIDLQRAMEIALLHDLAEVRMGDLPRTASRYFEDGAKARAESAALDEILAPLPAESLELHAEYAAGATREARLVKACDKLQLMVKVLAYEGWGATGLAEFWDNEANFPGDEFAPVAELVGELKQRHQGRGASS